MWRVWSIQAAVIVCCQDAWHTWHSWHDSGKLTRPHTFEHFGRVQSSKNSNPAPSCPLLLSTHSASKGREASPRVLEPHQDGTCKVGYLTLVFKLNDKVRGDYHTDYTDTQSLTVIGKHHRPQQRGQFLTALPLYGQAKRHMPKSRIKGVSYLPLLLLPSTSLHSS